MHVRKILASAKHYADLLSERLAMRIMLIFVK